jgi:site-specific recombinase XerD
MIDRAPENGTTALALIAQSHLPAIVNAAGDRARLRFVEFFTANVSNNNTRRAYAKAAAQFFAWCSAYGVSSIAEVQTLHVATYIQELAQTASIPTVNARLSALRHLFDWFVVGQVIGVNPAASVRPRRYAVRKGKTAVLERDEVRRLLASIDTTTYIGLRDRALIGLMAYTFARIGAALAMKVDDVFIKGHRHWVRLLEKCGKPHELPCHHNLEVYMIEYIQGTGVRGVPKSPLFRACRHNGELSPLPLRQAKAHAMVRRRARAAGIETPIGNHSFRATGITAYLSEGGTLEIAAAWPIMRQRARRSSMIAAKTTTRSRKLNASVTSPCCR